MATLLPTRAGGHLAALRTISVRGVDQEVVGGDRRVEGGDEQKNAKC